MGTLKKKVDGIWKTIASSQASEIGVKSPNLLPEGIEQTNVEKILNDFATDIKTLKGNVSWLAKHGGGGSGSGSGGGSVDTNNNIVVNGYTTGNNVTLKESISIQIQASDSSSKWNLSIRVDNTAVKSINSISPGKETTLTKKELTNAGITKSQVTLNITATNPSTLQNIYWTGVVNIANSSLSVGNFSYNFDEFDSKSIVFNYTVGVLGRYDLEINGVVVSPGVELKTTSGEIEVNVGDIYTTLGLSVGSNTLISRIINCEDNTIISDYITSYITIVTDTPVIQCTALSSSSSSPTPVYVTSGGETVVQVPYTVYYDGVSYKAKIYSSLDNIALDDVNFEEVTSYNSYNTNYPNGSYKLANVAFGTTVKIIIAIEDQGTGLKRYSQEFYIITQQSSYDLLDNGQSANKLFDYITYNGIIENKQWTDSQASYATELTIGNVNTYSESIDAEKRRLRLQNTSYATITPESGRSSFYNILTSKSTPTFTLSICYKADFHPDDYRTIFQFATLYDETLDYVPQTGIVIKDHMLYVGANTLTLRDNTLTNLTISYSIQEGDTFGDAFVYVDGVLEAAFKIEPSVILPKQATTIYLGCSEKDGTTIHYCDTDIYRVTLYKSCLTPYEILYDYLNTQAYVNLTTSGLLDSSYIQEGLKRNFISTAEDGTHTSLLWSSTADFNNNKDNFSSCFNVGNLVGGEPVKLKDTLSNYDIPIPIMLIDVSSADAWTWQNFITPNSGLNTVTGCSFQYLDQTQSNNEVISGYVDVSVQGTSTLADFIKNLNITFADGTVFIPKKNWFPETTYTLKADIVDSSHSLNASIGKFVNEELGFKYNEDGTLASTDAWYPYSETVATAFKEKKQDKSSAIQKYFPHANLKHGIEGFPVFVIMQFAGNTTATLGIYQFILGRNSPRNLGYEIINKVTGMTEGITYPYYNNNVQIETQTIKGYWVEMTENNSFGVDDNFQEINDSTEFSNTKFTGAFWQNDGLGSANHGTYYDKVAEIKYTNLGQNAVSSLYDFEPFAEFVNSVQKLPVTNRRYSKRTSSVLQRNSYFNIDYPKYLFKEIGSTTSWSSVTGESNHIANTGDELEEYVKNLNIESITKYFVICMFFGLLDNFQKNMPLKFYQDSNGNWEKAILGIYDTDSGAGATNEADVKVASYLWLCPFKNVDNQLVETSESSDDNVVTNIIGNSCKLWYLDSDALNYTLYGDSGREGSIFTSQWYSLISKLGAAALTDLVTKFMDEYFIPQTEGCGELLFNLTYFTKYLNKYTQNGVDVNQYSKLHGRRISQVRSWMTDRVKFLDSMFTAMGTTSVQQTIVPGSVNITAGSAPTFNITTNNSMILSVDSQGSNNEFVFVNKNVETDVYWGAESTTSQQVSHTISYPATLQKLGNDEYSLSDIYYQKLQGSIPNLTEYNVSNCSKLESLNADGMDSFKQNGSSELRIIDATNTAKTSTSGFNYILNLQSGFQKLQELNIKNSCVTQIELPTNPCIPLSYIDVTGSQLTKLNLESQNLIETLDLTNCSKLTTVTITNCEKFKSLTLDKTQSALTSVSINSDTFETFVCENNSSITSVVINSSSLKSVKITGCSKLASVLVNGTSLTELNLSNNPKLDTLTINKPRSTMNTLNLYGTALKTIYYDTDNTSTNTMDLSKFEAIVNLNLNANSALEYLQFSNQSIPFALNSSFSSCPNLTRIFGNVSLGASGMFSGCTKFSLFGTDVESVQFKGKSVYDTKNKKVLHPTEISGVTSNSKMVQQYQGSAGYSNFSVGTTSLASMFKSTSCTLWDVYYILYQCTDKVTNLASAFYTLKNTISGTTHGFLHRNTFINCTGVTSLNATFYGSLSAMLLYSPTFEESGDDVVVTEDNGLFSPLVKCTDINYAFTGTYYIDRGFFKRKPGGVSYALTSVSNFNPALVVSNLNDFSTLDALKSITSLVSSHPNIGNFNGFFDYTPNVTSITGSFRSCGYINFDKSGTFLPSKLTNITGSFSFTYGEGTIDFPTMLKAPGLITTISGSFNVSSSNTYDCYFYLSNDTFKGMVKLATWNYDSTYTYLHNVYSSGIKRVISGSEFPYSIFSPCKNTITSATYLFYNTQKNENLGVVELPGSLFLETTKMSNIAGCFASFNNSFVLTSEGFKNCTNLTNVSALFYRDSSADCMNTGCIPNKFFYQGKLADKTYTYTFLDPDSAIDPTKYTVAEDGSLIYPTIPEEMTETITFTVPQYRANITNIEGCFRGFSADSYENPSPEIENNPNYMPFKYYLKNGVWLKADTNNAEYTYAWEFDGMNHIADYDKHPENYETYDDDFDANTITTKTFRGLTLNNGGLRYCAPPDLLRYCSSSLTNVDSLFRDTYKALTSQTQISEVWKYSGIKGRICPYMFKPVPNITSMQYMFYGCLLIDCYTYESYTYLIPKSFFKYTSNLTDMSYAFSNNVVPYNINLDVFSAGANYKKTLNVDYMFYRLFYNTTASNSAYIGQIFKGISTNKLKACFAQHDTSDPSGSSGNSQQYITFDAVFDKNKIGSGNDTFVFNCYSKDYVTFSNPTLRTLESAYNYYYSDRTYPEF